MRLSVKSGTKIDTVVKKVKKMLEDEYKDGILTTSINIYMGQDMYCVHDCEIRNGIQEAYAYARTKFRNEMLSFFENYLNMDIVKEIEKQNAKYRKYLEQGQTVAARKYKERLEEAKELEKKLPFYKKLYAMAMSTNKKSAIHLELAEIGRKWVIVKAYQEFNLDDGTQIFYANKNLSKEIDENFGNRYKFSI